MNYSNYNNHVLKQIIPLYFWEPFDQDFSGKQESIKGVIKLILVNVWASIRHFKKIKGFNSTPFEKGIVLCYNPKPKKDVLNSLKPVLANEFQIAPPASLMEDKDFTHLYFGYLGLRYSFHHLIWYYSLKGYERKAYRNKFWHCYYDLGKYRYMLKQFKKSRTVKCFVATNDHIGFGRIGFVAAKKSKIKSVYIQHASVSDKFPPLMVDLALLEGADAKKKYKIAPDCQVKIELIGSLKYDLALNDPAIDSKSNIVGICVNMFENEQYLTLELCQMLERRNIEFIIRFHPHLQMKDISPNFKDSWEYSDTTTETESDFILKCGTVVSGDSSILLDTIVLKRRPLYFTKSTKISDYYGFLENGLVTKKFSCTDDIINEIQKTEYDISEQRNSAKLYIETLDTPFEGKSSHLAMKFINEFNEP